MGCRVEESDPPSIDECSAVAIGHWVSFCALLVELLGPDAKRLDPSLLEMAARGAAMSAQEVTALYVRRGELGSIVNGFFDRFDLLVAPVIYCNPPSLANLDQARPLVPQTTNWCNVTGLPAASVPCGFTSNGLPIGLQIVGRRHADVDVLRASHAFEQAARSPPARSYPWADRTSPAQKTQAH